MRVQRWCGLLVGGVLLTACGDGGESVAPGSSAASTTVAVSTTVDAVATSTVAVGTWTRECADYVRDTPSVPVVDEAELNTFGPLAVEPGLTIELPLVNASFNYPVPSATRIPGGVLVAASTDRTGYPAGGSMAPAGTVLAAIDDDGSVRWLRCLDRTAQLSGVLDSNGLITLDWENYDTAAMRTINLADGAIANEVVELESSPFVVTAEWVGLAQTLGYRSADGELLWQDTGLAHYGGEAQNLIDIGEVLVVSGCPTSELDPAGEFGCRAPLLRAYRSKDGQVLWERPGAFRLSLASGEFAIVSTTDGEYRMIDAKEGDDIPGQSWSADTGFPQGCCADLQTWSRAEGGVVISSQGSTIRVYYPIDAGVTPHTVVLP